MLLFMALLTWAIGSYAAQVDTLLIKSAKMNKGVKVIVICPDGEANQRFPAFYLLHGYSGNERTWLGIKPDLPQMADRDGIMVICPDGENSWYWDSPLHKDSQFETFVSEELVDYIDSHYPTIANREHRGISGLSMGGHGGMWLGIRHKDVFGAAGSMSGGLDIRPFPNNWQMKKQLGEKAENEERWNDFTAINQLDGLKNNELAIIIDCGADDFFLEVNTQFHQELLRRGINHDFTIRPGRHDTPYWNNAIEYQWLFMKRFFNGYRSPQKGK